MWCKAAAAGDSVPTAKPASCCASAWQRESRARFPQKDIGGVIGLHNSIFEASFDEEGGAVKLPHAVQEIEVREERLTGGKEKDSTFVRHQRQLLL